jgi:hypothetical protein
MTKASVAQKLSTTEEEQRDQSFYFKKEITETKATTPKNCFGFHPQ